MDYGYPQFTEAKILSEFIKTDAYKMEVHVSPLEFTSDVARLHVRNHT
jgi:hypothetical protein